MAGITETLAIPGGDEREADLNLDCSGGGGEVLTEPKGRRRCSSRCRICDPTDVGDGTEKRPEEEDDGDCDDLKRFDEKLEEEEEEDVFGDDALNAVDGREETP